MDSTAELIDYHETGYFSKIVTDYISQDVFLRNFYSYPVSLQGIRDAVAARKSFNTDRQLLVEQLNLQYSNVNTSQAVKSNIELLLNAGTFTICTAHQPNIFSGHLYFIYKIVHVIKLANHLNDEFRDEHFVPVFYMGSEDADLEELGHIYINGDKHEWNTKQTGAVGRMKVDDDLIKILDEISGQLLPEPFGKDVIDLMKTCYVKGETIQQSTFKLIDLLFSSFGLIVLIPDNGELKKVMATIFEEDIFENVPSEIVSRTTESLSKKYKIQAHPREINLFYLVDDKRNRIEESHGEYRVNETSISFTKSELLSELKDHPERFSPNVILRGLFQETILPNIAFIGGGGEIAYWLELKELFEHYKVPFPMLIIRNSFLIIEEKVMGLVEKTGILPREYFKSAATLLNDLVKANTNNRLSLQVEKEKVEGLYNEIKETVKEIDHTLIANAEALKARALKNLTVLEKKMLKAEKRKFEGQQRQIQKVKKLLFPNDNLQERVDNFMPLYAKWGKDLIDLIYTYSNALEQKLTIVTKDT